ncbi:glucosamine-6-phosphate deaminase [Brevibacillus sp. FSL K6-0770]|uniref:Glucosamine-6-phosphate deaminase n=1 Tax=Brevibacillus parabrevis TaxID=54914 RepID=A0A4Y3PTA7_BREPA|nr:MULTISPECIES: glucosamine-6-phosphate deaminase [Brevibacillus]MBU8714691.1 glucosamine-6-phosphate deaminase [Brevibacillus parabrevis]MDH6353141.1 glucosamine-6-phosphate deaminase [Brevibacillus sp. 1238]RNB93396.1 glucosamine-6-phosphate deaminase [Brevibacillus parabrevis]GEB34618.1 glucosamine-6-phosphate deaminase [Brevibacillus parabrevis]HBZ79341.1 glucosamine-6-phosphate deaminase [Brevibacillus sp.]
MKLVIVKDYQEMSRKAAELLASEVKQHPQTVLGLATGGTPVGMYRELIKLHEDEGIDFSQAQSFNLDEYVGLSSAHPQSYRAYMQENLFQHINLPADKTHVPTGDAVDLDKECARYEEAIREAGGIDIQVLGIGNNGHIGFNEPGSSAESTTRVVQLTESTIEANARYFASVEEVPTQAVSMGIKTILGAKKVVLLASGEAKAQAVRLMVEGEPTADVPASLLQLHPDVTVIVDEAAASQLTVAATSVENKR